MGFEEGLHLYQTVEDVEQLLLVEGPFYIFAIGDLGLQGVEVVFVFELDRDGGTTANPPVPQKLVCSYLCSRGRKRMSCSIFRTVFSCCSQDSYSFWLSRTRS